MIITILKITDSVYPIEYTESEEIITKHMEYKLCKINQLKIPIFSLIIYNKVGKRDNKNLQNSRRKSAIENV